MKAAVVLGAGFSRNSGLPVLSQIPELLINYKPDIKFEQNVSSILKNFMEDIFGYRGKGNYPALDDMFTCIDISTNSGHHLGMSYSPLHLRAVRRLLVYRVFSILHESFTLNKDISELIRCLYQTFKQVDFVVLNWDTVLEKYLQLVIPDIDMDYNNGGFIWKRKAVRNTGKTGLYKIHGSNNWLYCDNCRSLFYDIYDDVPIIKKAGFQKLDFTLYPDLNVLNNGAEGEATCNFCGNSVSSHIATFSYRKTFKANSFANVWNGAEKVLTEADRWIFIGYSLPDADYEFKHLLKISQLKMKHSRPRGQGIDVVLLNSNNTVDRYKGFFGNSLNHICNNGINEFVGYVKSMV